MQCRAVRYLYTCNNVRKTHREKQVWLLQSYGSYLRSLSRVCVCLFCIRLQLTQPPFVTAGGVATASSTLLLVGVR
jgi:hypothetical protein